MANKLGVYSVALGFATAIMSVGTGGTVAWAEAGSPGGNNGTIKIDEYTVDSGNDNDPHVTCDFSVSFFGFDSGQQNATITVTPWAPTTGGTPYQTGGGWNVGTRTAGNQYDYSIHVSAPDLSNSLAGVTPNAQQGYHLKLEAEVSGAKGSDDKYKVFWLQPCSTGSTTASTRSNSSHSSANSTNGRAQNSTRYSALSSPAASSSLSAVPSTPASTPASSSSASAALETLGGLNSSTAGTPAALGGLNASPAATSAQVPASLGASRSSARVPVAMGGLNSAGTSRSAPSALAFTGADIAGTATGGLALIGLGTLLTLRSRRRIAVPATGQSKTPAA